MCKVWVFSYISRNQSGSNMAAAVSVKALERKPRLLRLLAPLCFCKYLSCQRLFHIVAGFSQQYGGILLKSLIYSIMKADVTNEKQVCNCVDNDKVT